MQIKESYVFNPDYIKTISDVVRQAGSIDIEWGYKKLLMKDSSTHYFITKGDEWHETPTLDSALAFVLDDLHIASCFYSEGFLITEKQLANKEAANAD